MDFSQRWKQSLAVAAPFTTLLVSQKGRGARERRSPAGRGSLAKQCISVFNFIWENISSISLHSEKQPFLWFRRHLECQLPDRCVCAHAKRWCWTLCTALRNIPEMKEFVLSLTLSRTDPAYPPISCVNWDKSSLRILVSHGQMGTITSASQFCYQVPQYLAQNRSSVNNGSLSSLQEMSTLAVPCLHFCIIVWSCRDSRTWPIPQNI